MFESTNRIHTVIINIYKKYNLVSRACAQILSTGMTASGELIVHTESSPMCLLLADIAKHQPLTTCGILQINPPVRYLNLFSRFTVTRFPRNRYLSQQKILSLSPSLLSLSISKSACLTNFSLVICFSSIFASVRPQFQDMNAELTPRASPNFNQSQRRTGNALHASANRIEC